VLRCYGVEGSHGGVGKRGGTVDGGVNKDIRGVGDGREGRGDGEMRCLEEVELCGVKSN